jgi:hypothetical protein
MIPLVGPERDQLEDMLDGYRSDLSRQVFNKTKIRG